MTRQEFIDTITDFYDLRDFALENDLDDQVVNLVTDYDINDDVDYAITDLAGDSPWRRVRDTLNDIPDYSGWFIRTGYLEYRDADADDLEELKQDVLEAADEKEVWDEEEDEELEPDGICDPDSVIPALFGAKAS